MKPTLLFTRLLGLVLLTCALGCSGQGHYQVRGQVVFEDDSDVAPLAGGLVVFDPADPAIAKKGARGQIKADGSFVMSTTTEGDGVLPGKYRVMVAPPTVIPKRNTPTPPPVLDERFQKFETSGLEITVPGDDYTLKVRKR
jgi:hypothetical protein